MHISALARTLPTLLLLLMLAGCVSNPSNNLPPADPQALHAAQLYENGNYRSAADLYLQMANAASETNRQLYLLLAADSLLHDNQIDKAQEIFAQISRAALPERYHFRYRLIQSDLELLAQRPANALQNLSIIPADATRGERIRAYHIRAKAYAMLEQPLAQTRELIALDQLLEDDDQHLMVQMQILQQLTHLKRQQLREAFGNSSGVSKGWVELALLLKSFPNDPRGIIAPFSEWRDLFPEHPAIPELLTNYYQQQQQVKPLNIRHIAVLLPQSGSYARPAEILRTGIISAWLSDTNENRPQLRFYDSSNTDAIWPLVNQAADDGADIIIGPLHKTAILQLARAGGLPIPVLALNQVDTDSMPPADLYQFSLSPEDEAHQAAVWARYRGLTRPAVLYPDNTLGKRMLNAFAQQWQELEGDAIISQSYAPKGHDLSNRIATLVNARQRKARMEAIQKWHKQQATKAAAEKPATVTPEEAPEPIPLPMDFIFAIGNKTQMRQIRPLLQFHYAANLPLLTTSRAWNGKLSRQEAFDLEGVTLPEMPWLVSEDTANPLSRAQMEKRFPQYFGKYLRLLPMGMDAYTILTQLRRLEHNGLEPFSGHTGELYLNEDNKLLRNLTWITLGIPPEVLGVTPRAESLDLMPIDLEELHESPASAQR